MRLYILLRRVRSAASAEDGMSMAELAVAMLLMVIAATIYLGAMTSVYTGVNRQQRRSEINDEARAAIQQIDREVRSGNFIANSASPTLDYLYDPATESALAPTCGGYACTPGFSFRVHTQANAPTRGVQCVQYLITGQKLMRRSWQPGTQVIIEGWRTIATDIVNQDVSPAVPAFSMGPGSRVVDVTFLVNNRFGQSDAPQTVRIASSVAMRNFGSSNPCPHNPSS